MSSAPNSSNSYQFQQPLGNNSQSDLYGNGMNLPPAGQSQNVLFVFHTALANTAAEKVRQGIFPSIIDFQREDSRVKQILLNTRPSAYSNPPGSNLSRSASTPTGQQSAPAANWTGKTPKTEMPPSPAPTAILTGASKPPSRPGSLPSTHVLEEKKLPSGSADSPKVGGTSPAAGDILTNPASAPPAMQDSNGGDNVGNMTAVNTGGKRPYSAVGDSLDPGRPLSYLDVSALSQQSGSSGAGMPPTSSLGSDPLQKMAQMASDTLPYEPLTKQSKLSPRGTIESGKVGKLRDEELTPEQLRHRQDAMAKLDVLKKMIDPRPLSGQPQPSQQQLQSQPPMGQISQGGQLQPQMSQIPLSPMEYQQQMQMNSGMVGPPVNMGPMGSQMCQPGRMIRPPGQMPMEPDYMSAEAQAKWNRMKSDFYGGAGPPPQMPPSSQFPPYPQPPMMSGRPPFAPAQMRPNAPPVRPGKVRPGGNSRSRARNAQQTAPVPVPQEFQRFPVPNQFQMEPEGLPYPPRGPIRYGPPPPQRQQFVPQQQHFVPPPQPYDMEPSYMPYPVDHMDMNAGVVGGDDAFFDLYSNQMDMGGGPGGGKAGPMGAKFDLVDPSAVQFHHQMSSSPQMQQSVMGPSVVGGGRQQSTVPPPTVNNTYVNATMTIQQMNIQNVGHGHNVNNQPFNATLNFQQMQMSSQQQQQQQSHHFTGPPHQQQPDGRQFGRPPPQQQQIGAGGGQFGQQQFVEPLTNLDSKVPSGKLQYFPAGNQPPTSQLQPDPDGYPMCQQSQQFTTVGGGGPPQQQQMSFMGEIDDFGVTDDFLSLQQTQQIQKVSRTGDSNGVTVGQQQQTAAYQAQSFQNFQQQLYSIGTTGNSTVSQQPRDNF